MTNTIAWILFFSFIIAIIFMFQSAGYGQESLWDKAIELTSLWFDAQIQSYGN